MVQPITHLLNWTNKDTEASLESLQDVQTQLADTQHQLQEEIDSLQAELKRNQDPERMSIIQEMISVRPQALIHVL